MAITGRQVSQEELSEKSMIVRRFFARGTRKEIVEIVICDEATRTIIQAMGAFHEAPVPLVVALSELLNFCRDLERSVQHHGVVPMLHSPDFMTALIRQG
jgi:hypothetical protein